MSNAGMNDCSDISCRYYSWLCNFGVSMMPDKDEKTWASLITTLADWEFYSDIRGDENRAADALELRRMFEKQEGLDIPDDLILTYLDFPVTILEVLIEMSIRADRLAGEIGNPRPYIWFGTMLFNMGLLRYDDFHYDETEVFRRVMIFLNRAYNPDGTGGGPFVLREPRADLRTTELWYQMQWYLSEILLDN